MHKIEVFSIEKIVKDSYENIVKEYKKMIGAFAKLNSKEFFSKQIALAQKKGVLASKKSYSDIYESKLGVYNIALDEGGEYLDSITFSKIFEKEYNIHFFIGGAYGFENGFLKKCDKVISLSKMTMSHKIAKIVLYEQIYRALSIVNKHPYHK